MTKLDWVVMLGLGVALIGFVVWLIFFAEPWPGMTINIIVG